MIQAGSPPDINIYVSSTHNSTPGLIPLPCIIRDRNFNSLGVYERIFIVKGLYKAGSNMGESGLRHVIAGTATFLAILFLVLVEGALPALGLAQGHHRVISSCTSWQARRIACSSQTVLLVVPQGDFTDREYKKTRKGLETDGFRVAVASTSLAEARGQEGTVIMPDVTIYEVRVEDYAAVVFIGGGGVGELICDAAALDLAWEAHQDGKTVGAICLAPVILAEAGVLEGRNATAIPSVSRRLIEGGADYVYEDVVVDGNIVTGCAPHASKSFGEVLADSIQP
jgi:protease I